MSTTTLEPTVTTTEIRETTLLEAGIVMLESSEFRQCQSTMRTSEMRCAEGIFFEVLIRAYPERFRWEGTAGYDNQRVDGSLVLSLDAAHWRLLHPLGDVIAQRAAHTLGHAHIAGANDMGVPFKTIATALRRSMEEFEREPLRAYAETRRGYVPWEVTKFE